MSSRRAVSVAVISVKIHPHRRISFTPKSWPQLRPQFASIFLVFWCKQCKRYARQNLAHIMKESFKGLRPGKPWKGVQVDSHCRGHRFESGMLHARTCRNASLFSCIAENMQEFCCNSCKTPTAFRGTPQFTPQLIFWKPGKSKKRPFSQALLA